MVAASPWALITPIHALRCRVSRFGGALLSRVPGVWAYLLLALGVAVWAAGNVWTDRGKHISSAAYDQMLGLRLWPPAPDPAIVILDIDERSLAAMSGEFGRWPWPREVLASVLDDLERQGARAVVFDILFSDPDIRNPGSERAFADSVARSKRSYFPVLRLDRANDNTSQLKLSQLPGLIGVSPSSGAPPGVAPSGVVDAASRSNAEATVALTLPYFEAIMSAGRIGTFNVEPDSDGVVRHYRFWERLGQARLWSLPARVAVESGWSLPTTARHRLNWPDQNLGYRRVSFSDYYSDTQRSKRERATAEFGDAIVVIGATAPALGDVKATAVKRLHPGVEILATAIDNLHTERVLNEIPLFWQYVLATALLAVMTWTTIRFAHDRLAWAFVAAPTALLAISYLSLNVGGLFGNVFLDLSAPASMALLYYSLAKLYNLNQRQYWAGERLYKRPDVGVGQRWNGMLSADLGSKSTNGLEIRLFDMMHRHAPHATLMLNPFGTVGWLAMKWSEVVLVTWDEPENDTAAHDRAEAEFKALATALEQGFSARVSAFCKASGAVNLRELTTNALMALGADSSKELVGR